MRRARRLDARAGVRHRRGAGSRNLALCRRRFRQQDAVEPPDPRRRRRQACRAPGAHHAVARRRLPDGRRTHAHRAARRDRRAGRRAFRCPDPHRRRRDDVAQQHARAVHPADALGLCRRELSPQRQSGRARHARQHLHARAGRIGRDLRARERGRRTRGRTRRRSDRAARDQRARDQPDDGYALLVAQHRRGVSQRRRALWLGQTERHAGHAA